MGKKLERILLIDDDYITNFLNERLIRKNKISESVHVTTNGNEALEYLIESEKNLQVLPDLILLDINMPVMDGVDFLRKYKETFTSTDTIIVVLTTSSHEKDIDSIKNLDNTPFLNKPLNEEKLNTIVKRYFWNNTSQSA